MRVKPTAWIGIALWVLYVLIFVVGGQISGIPYDNLGDSASNLWLGVNISLIVGGVVIAGIAAGMGWFGWRCSDERARCTRPSSVPTGSSLTRST